MADLAIEKDEKFKAKGPPDSVKMSQLDRFLQEALISTHHVQNCAVINRHEGTVKASSLGFTLPPDQIKVVISAFNSTQSLRERGITYQKEQYKCVRADYDSIYAKNGKAGLILVRTESFIVLATYSENMYPGVCVEAVEKLADYFKEKGK